jgi:hypothetical protein
MDIRSERLGITGGEIIEPADLMPFACQLVSKRRAEESRGSSNQEVHK